MKTQTLFTLFSAVSVNSFAILSRSQKLSTNISNKRTRRPAMTMYFDDISRNNQGQPPQRLWTPASIASNASDEKKNQIRFASTPNKPKEPDYASTKLDMLQKVLHGFDASSAARLEVTEVKDIMDRWVEDSCVANDFLRVAQSDFEYNLHVHNSTSVVGCIRHLWNHIHNRVNEVHLDTVNVSPICMDIVVFPNCPALYKYQVMSKVNDDIGVCSDDCNALGTDFVVSAFHPHYEFEPRMLSPERHSPFPCFGIHGIFDDMNSMDESVENVVFGLTSTKDGHNRDNESRSGSDNDREVNSLRNDMQDIDKNRNELEALFNSVAASESNVVMGRSNMSTDCIDSDVYDNYFISTTQNWMNENSKDGTNAALKCSSVLLQESERFQWEVSDSVLEESIYNEIWNLIHRLENEVESQSSSLSSSPSSSSSEVKKDACMSTSMRTAGAMFVATKFSTYNAQKFKRLAITINKTLKKTKANDNVHISMELYHPEFIGKTEAQSQMRRSPFPSLQFIAKK